MTMMPMYKICPICGRRYSWNPDVGMMFCPKCRMVSLHEGVQAIWRILSRKKK